MLLIETSIKVLAEYINLWNNEYMLALEFRGQRGKYVAWSVGNALITGIEVAPNRILFEFDNFNLQGTDQTAQKATQKLIELLKSSFTIDNTAVTSRAFSIMARQAERTLRIMPASLANVKLNRKTKTEFKARAKEDNPEITDEEINKMWVNYRQLVEQQKVKQDELERRRNMTADDAVEEWWRRVSVDESKHRIPAGFGQIAASGVDLIEKYATQTLRSTTAVDSNFSENKIVNETPTRNNSANKTLAIVLFILGVSITVFANVATQTLPDKLKPYLWLSWPLLVVFVAVSVILVLKQ